MIQRLDEAQTRQLIRDLMPEFAKWETPDLLSEKHIADFCGGMAALDVGRCYGLFDDALHPQGFFVGMICEHPESGVLVGIEHEWRVAKHGSGGLALLERFEEDCRAAGCKGIISGYSNYNLPERMHKIYTQRGYKPFSVSMFKEF